MFLLNCGYNLWRNIYFIIALLQSYGIITHQSGVMWNWNYSFTSFYALIVHHFGRKIFFRQRQAEDEARQISKHWESTSCCRAETTQTHLNHFIGPFKGTDPFFLPILIINIIFFFLGEKVSSGIWETCPKILGGYVYQNPPKWGLIYIYIIVCITL